MRGRVLASVVAVSLMTVACGSSESSRPSADAVPTSTTATSRTTSAVTTPASLVEQWDLVVFGDSFSAKNGWPTQFAEMVAAESGHQVSVDGDVCFGGCASLPRIRESEKLQDVIADAEFIVLQPQPGRVVAPLWRTYAAGDCGGDDDLACFRQAEAEFREYVDDLFDEVIARSNPGTVIRTMRATGTWAIDGFHPGLRDADPDQFDVFLDNMLVLSEHVAEAAADRCILAVDVNAIMSGADYRQPVDPDYSDDGQHPSEEGSRVIAAALNDLGYEPHADPC